MAFDQSTRNRLSRFVGDARNLLTDEFTRQCQDEYGLDPATGDVAELGTLARLDDARRETARLLRDTLAHYIAAAPGAGAAARKESLVRIVREQAFTVLNRLCALRLAEARGLLVESVAKGYTSTGFRLYAQLAGPGLGETGDAYAAYLFSVFDEFAVDLPVLFDRFSPSGRLFPRETVLLELLAAINDPELEPLWAEDETIGWIYQYFNGKDERKAMRDASAAPRNSRELAVRNQFFTPRYVVEFLTDNTLGRIWYEMTRGQTGLKEQCHYLVRRPTEIFLPPGETAPIAETVMPANAGIQGLAHAEAYAPPDTVMPAKAGIQGPAHTEAPPPSADLTQEELLRQPVYIPHRPLKDPREILMLDPACGSMHFGLYAFDLFERIYEEAWEMQSADRWPGMSGRCLIDDYPTKEALLRDVPRLILERNIHGIDIDPRAVQIAGLSLWLRAQRSWHAQGLRPEQRPAITRSNIVCAEPMPGEAAFLEEFLTTTLSSSPEDRLLGQIVRRAFEAMKLAGEAGSLLKIEEEIAGAVAEAKQKWQTKPAEQAVLIEVAPAKPKQAELELDVRGITDEAFWDLAEENIYAALRDFAERATTGGFQKRLFAEDVARGFSFIDVCRKYYDAVLMNPPFGLPESGSKTYVFGEYPDEKYDLYACFVTIGLRRSNPRGLVGSLTNRTCFSLESLARWRKTNMLSVGRLATSMDLGYGVLDGAMVEAAAYVIEANGSQREFSVLNLLNQIDKADAAWRMFRVPAYQTPPFYRHLHQAFLEIPSHPIAYNVPSTLISKIVNSVKVGDVFEARAGLQTNDDFRFLRLLWEISPAESGVAERWVHLSKGGDYLPLISDIHVAANWADNGREMKVVAESLYDQWSRTIPSMDFQLRPGVTYSERTTSGVSLRAMPHGCLFTKTGPGVFGKDLEDDLLLIGLSYSRFFRLACEMFVGGGDESVSGSAARHYRTALIARLPIVDLRHLPERRSLVQSIKLSIEAATSSKARDETFINYCGETRMRSFRTLSEAYQDQETLCLKEFEQLSETLVNIESCVTSWYLFTETELGALDELQERFLGTYQNSLNGLEAERSIVLWRGTEGDATEYARQRLGASRQIVKKAYFIDRKIELLSHIFEVAPSEIIRVLIEHSRERQPTTDYGSQVLSVVIGGVFGRWDIRFATGERSAPELPDPFAPLPVCPPGMLQNAAGLPAAPADVPADYPLRIPWGGILPDDAGHPDDIERRVRDALRVIWAEQADAIEQEACEILGVKTLREYFRKPGLFFADHLKRYSKSRRQAPIYWPLSTPSGSYTLWLYYHRLSDQTLYTCVNDFVEPRLKAVAEQAAGLARKTGRSGKDEEEIEQLTTFEAELKDFRAELLRVAAFWKPNLNDGVQITAAPLWRLFQFKPWQKKLKETWAALEAGDYDWAHLAYSVWPARVREKCKTDKSLAIAHDLESVYVEPPASAKKKAGRKKKVETETERLIESDADMAEGE